MKAVMKTSPQPGIEVVDVPYPELKPDWVILRIHAVGICGSDIHTYHSTWKPMFEDWSRGGFKKHILGHEFSAEIEEVGKEVKGFAAGDRVVANKIIPCGKCEHCRLGLPWCTDRVKTDGAMAEYLAMPARSLFRIPAWVGYEAAALCEPLTVALYAVQDISSLTAGQLAVVLGPGPIGLATVMAAKLLTPRTIVVTGTRIDVSPRLEAAKKLGAGVIVNVDEEDPVKKVLDLTKGLGADVVYEAAGVPLLRQGLAMLRYGGEYIAIGHPGSMKPEPIVFDSGDYYRMQSKRQKVLTVYLEETRNWQTVADLLWERKVDLQPLVSHVLPLSDAVKGFEIAASRKSLKVVLVP